VIAVQVSGYQGERCPGKAGHPNGVRKPICNRDLEKSSVHAFTVSGTGETYAIVRSTKAYTHPLEEADRRCTDIE